MLALSLNLKWYTRQVDFSDAFVQAELKENVYINMLQHLISDDGMTSKEAVLKLNKSLYGLVQAPMYWFNHLSDKLKSKGFKPSAVDPCLFYGRRFIILVYVDDCLFFGPDEQKIEDFIKELQDDGMSLTCEDDAFHFLNVEVVHHDDGRVELLQKVSYQKC